MADSNLSLDVDWVGHDEGRRRVVRVCVSSAHGFTRDGGAPTITVDCIDKRTFEAELNRLHCELDDVASKASEFFGESAQAVIQLRDAEIGPIERSGDLKVQDVMTTNVKTVYRNDELSLAKELMDTGQFRHLVVLDRGEEHVVGIISRQDIYYGALAWSLGMSEPMHQKMLSATTAKSVMRSDVLTTVPEAPLREAASVMLANKIGCLPVLDGVKLVGIVTESDLLAQIRVY